MKANELFTGALVRVNRDGLCIKKNTIVEVRGVDADDRLAEKGLVGSAHCHPLDENQFAGGIWCEYLDPIRLTQEILEKNGFERGTYELPVSGKKIPKYSYAEVEGDIKEVALLPLTMNFTWSFSAVDGTHIPVLEFVHQLQHALRLCGVVKEIELLNPTDGDADYYKGKIDACRDIQEVITSLQQEQPKVDWEKEIDKFLNETGAPYVWCNDDEQKEWCNIIARHFWNKGYNARKKEEK